MDAKGVERIFKLLGLPVPSLERLESIAADGRSAEQVRDDLLSWGKNQGGDTYQNMVNSYAENGGQDPDLLKEAHAADTTEAPKGEEKDGDKIGIGAGDDLTILVGKEMTWHFDKETGKWYVEYGLPNSTRSIIFEATPQQMDQLWGQGRRPAGYQNTTLKRLTQQQGTTFGGGIAQMAGKGSFEAEVQRVTTLALDEGRLPEWAKADGEVLDILYTAQAEDKSDEWALEQISKLPSFKKRFPKIQKFMSENNLTLADGIAGFLEFEAGVNKTLQSFGYENALKNVSPELVGNLLDRGYSLEAVQDTVGGFKRLKEFKPALDAFNKILEANGAAPLTKLDEMLKFVQGKAPATMYDLWEQSSIQEAAVSAGLGDIFSVRDAINASKGGEFTLETATQGMQKAAELLLRLRHEVAVGKYGLDHEELIDISMGLTPRSGRSQAEIHENINRAVAAAQKSLQGRSQPFTSFSAEGRPQAASLQSLRQQT